MTYRLTDIYGAIAEKKRRDILDSLRHEPLNVAAIAARFTISRTAVEKHLKVLLDADLITSERVGRERILRMKPAALEEVWAWLEPYSAYWSERLTQLKEIVESDTH